jgi:glycosyltransferase involved in cell wall biosynthesis
MIHEYGRDGEKIVTSWANFWDGEWGPRVCRPFFRLAGRRAEKRVQQEGIPTRRFPNRPSHVCFVSEYLRTLYRKAGLEFPSSEVIYGGVPTAQFYDPIRGAKNGSQPLRILYAGQISPDRGLHTVVDALALMDPAVLSKLTLTVAGESSSSYSSYLSSVKSRLEDMGLMKCISFLGKVPHERMPQIYKQHDVLVFPSTRPEGLPLTMVEAMLGGCAVVTTGSGGAMEIAAMADLPLFPKHDPVALNQILVQLVFNRAEVSRIASRGQEVALREFSFERMMNRWSETLQRIHEANASAVMSRSRVALLYRYNEIPSSGGRIRYEGPCKRAFVQTVPRLRVLYLPSWYPHPNHPTYSIFLRVQAEALAKWHQLLVVPIPKGTSLLSSPRSWIDRCEFRRSPGGLFELYAKGPNYTPRFPDARERTLWRLYCRSFAEATRVLGGPPDLIHAQVSVEAGYFAARLARKYDRPFVLTEQTARPELLLTMPDGRKRFLYAMHAADCVMALSPMARDLLYKAGVNRQIDVVPNMIDTDFFSPGPSLPPPPIRLIVVGNLIPRKGIHYLIEALAQLRANDGLPLQLEVVGKGECRQQLESAVTSFGIAKWVHFHGEMSQAQVRDLLRQCHIYVSSSLTESFGVAVIEAMSVGLPVVVTRSGGPESYVTPTHGVVVEPSSSKELARGIRDVVKRLKEFDPQKQHQYIADQFSQEVVVREITKRYYLALEMHGKPAQFGRSLVSNLTE